MTLADRRADPVAAFGAGGGEPYARALRSPAGPRLYLHDVMAAGGAAAELDLARWSADADDDDRRLLAAVRGPVLDVGCGPARMVRAALDLGLDAWGIDVSTVAVEGARARGLPVLQGSVFDPLPHEGAWQTVLLVDGNIGIGGDVAALLARCAALIAADGEIVAEVHEDPDRDRSFTGRLTDVEGRTSAVFPWAEAGVRTLVRRAADAGLRPLQSWSTGSRSFCRLARSRA